MFFHQRLLQEIEHARATDGRMAVMLMDLDHFKEINDTLGHHFGDLLLSEIGPRLSGVLARQRPDGASGRRRVRHRAARPAERGRRARGSPTGCSRSWSSRCRSRASRSTCRASIGIALFPMHAEDAETLLRRADVAMYAAKETGGGYEVYSAGERPAQPAAPHADRRACGRPSTAASSSCTTSPRCGCRRARGGRRGADPLAPPDARAGAARRVHPARRADRLLRPLTHLRARRRCSASGAWWARTGIAPPVAVNLSPRNLLDADFPDPIARLLARVDVPPAVPHARDHRERHHERLRALDRGARRAARTRRGAVDRRLRHRLLVALLPQAAPDRAR